MVTLKLVLWNTEWMNDLFSSAPGPAAFKPEAAAPAHQPGTTVLQRRRDLAGVLNELAPDLVVVVEGPNRTEELQLFFDQDVQGRWTAQVQPSKGQSQNIGIALRTDQDKFQDPPLTYYDANQISAFDAFAMDTDDDEVREQYSYERRPLYVEVKPRDGRAFRVLGLHLKSKGIFTAYEWSKWWQVSDGNRRKILAEATELRLRFLNPYLLDPQTQDIPLVVCGDFNDGPGMDASEKRLLGSGVERLMGSIWQPHLCLGNALFDTLPDKDQANLNFGGIATTRYQDPIFNNIWQSEWIDHILYSLCQNMPFVTGARANQTLPDGTPIWKKYKHASDHYPVSALVTP